LPYAYNIKLIYPLDGYKATWLMKKNGMYQAPQNLDLHESSNNHIEGNQAAGKACQVHFINL
jgi:hypothetical protein